MNSKKKQDLLLGSIGEQNSKKILDEYFNCNFEETNKYHNFDFKCKDIYVEVKTRRIKSYSYDTLFFSYSKYKYIKKNPNYEYYFLYNLEDGYFLWKYNEKELTFKMGGRKDRGKNEIYKVCNVPSNKLKLIKSN